MPFNIVIAMVSRVYLIVDTNKDGLVDYNATSKFENLKLVFTLFYIINKYLCQSRTNVNLANANKVCLMFDANRVDLSNLM